MTLDEMKEEFWEKYFLSIPFIHRPHKDMFMTALDKLIEEAKKEERDDESM